MVDAYWEYRLKPWDMAAGIIIAQVRDEAVDVSRGRVVRGGSGVLVPLVPLVPLVSRSMGVHEL